MAKIKESYNNLEGALHYLLDVKDEHNKLSKAFNYFMMFLIILSVGEMTLETDDSIFVPYRDYFLQFDFFTVIVFTFEYVSRILTAHLDDEDYQIHRNKWKSIKKYIFSFYGLIDLISILPYYLSFTNIDLRILRMFRLFRFLRVLKIARYNRSIDIIGSVFKEKQAELMVTSCLIIIVMIISSFVMYYAEHEDYPEAFPNVISCFWWAIVTLTTIGYGDVVPQTLLGKIVGGIMAFLGIGLVAMPTGIISAGFLQKISEIKETQKSDNKIKDNKSTKTEDENPDTSNDETEENANESCKHDTTDDNGKKHYCPYCGHRLD